MTTIKHPATLIHNGVVIAMAISFAAALGMIEQLTGLSFQRGAARARVNFYKGREYYRAVDGDCFAIVPTRVGEYTSDDEVHGSGEFEDLIELGCDAIPAALATYMAAAIHTGNVDRINELAQAHREELPPRLSKVTAYTPYALDLKHDADIWRRVRSGEETYLDPNPSLMRQIIRGLARWWRLADQVKPAPAPKVKREVLNMKHWAGPVTKTTTSTTIAFCF